MDYFKSYRKDGVILFDLNLINANMDEDRIFFIIESNLPDEFLEKAYPNHIDDLMKINYQDKSSIEMFLNSFFDAIIQQPEAFYFYYPTNSIGRIIDREKFIRKIVFFDVEDIALNKLLSINENQDAFYFISKEFSCDRLYGKDLEKDYKFISQKEFETLLLPEFGEAYFEFYNEGNNYLFGKDDIELNEEVMHFKFLMLTDVYFFPLMFLWIPS